MQRLFILLLLLSSSLASAESFSISAPQEKKILGTDVVLSKGSLIEVSNNALKLLQGDIWIVSTKKLHVKTVYGDIILQGSNLFVSLDLEKDQMKVRLSDGRAVIENRLGDKIPLNYGEEIWLGSLMRNGTQSQGAPGPVQWSWFLNEWAQKFPFKTKISEALPSIKKVSSDRVDVSALTDEAVIKRKLASEKEKEEAEQARRRARGKEKSKLRQQFFDRVFYR